MEVRTRKEGKKTSSQLLTSGFHGGGGNEELEDWERKREKTKSVKKLEE